MVEHGCLGSSSCIHQQLYILGHASRESVQSQQVFRCIGGIIFRQNFLQDAGCKRPDGHEARLTVIQRLFLVLEYLGHHGVYRTADYQVYTGLLAIEVPDALHVAEHRFVYTEKLLELVDEERDGAFCRELHQVFEHIGKAFRASHGWNPQLVLYLQPVILA